MSQCADCTDLRSAASDDEATAIEHRGVDAGATPPPSELGESESGQRSSDDTREGAGPPGKIDALSPRSGAADFAAAAEADARLASALHPLVSRAGEPRAPIPLEPRSASFLLPCRSCLHSSSEQQEWRQLASAAETLGDFWERAKEARIDRLRVLPQCSENRVLEADALVAKSSAIVHDLKKQLAASRHSLQYGSEEESTLFSLFPFGFGTPKPRQSARSLEQSPDASSRIEAGRAVQASVDLMIEMLDTLLDQRLELNAYIGEIVRSPLEKDRALHSSLVRSPEPGLDDFLREQDIEEDAAEVEL